MYIYLVRDQESLSGAEAEDLVVVGGEVWRVEDLCADSEDGQVLDVGVVLDRVARDVVRVVRALPPAGRDAHERVHRGGAEEHVVEEDVRDAGVAQVVAQTSELEERVKGLRFRLGLG